MAEMKDSGIHAIGRIPKEWNVVRTKYLSNISIGLVTTMTENYVEKEEGVPLIRNGNIRCNKIDVNGMVFLDKRFAEKNKHRQLHTGQIATVHTGDVGTSIVIPEEYDGCLGFATIQSTPYKGVSSEFLCWFYNSAAFKNQCIECSTGDGRQNLNLYDFVDLFVAIPKYALQSKIASFLDKKCAEIDSLHTDIEKQIETLEEYKKSIITEAVTKGLDPDVEMKDSGIEWIGMIPKHWKVDMIKYHFRRNEPRKPINKEIKVLSVYREYGVIPKDSRDDNHNVTSEDTSKYKFVKKGDLVINKMKAWQGSLAVSDYEGIVSPAYFIYEFTDNQYNKKYFHYLIRGCYKDEFRRISGGIREGQWDLSAFEFAKTLILIPTIEEQNKIVEYIDDVIEKTDEIIADKKQQLETLEQYKKSLIYEYVTGKKEVR